jgi:hypothetical protein
MTAALDTSRVIPSPRFSSTADARRQSDKSRAHLRGSGLANRPDPSVRPNRSAKSPRDDARRPEATSNNHESKKRRSAAHLNRFRRSEDRAE